MSPWLSIVVINRDGRSFLDGLLRSVARQEGVAFPYEVIVVDNASADGSAEWLAREHPAVRVVRNPRNLGFAGPCNQGVEVARGTWIAFLNNDIELDPGWLATTGREAQAGRHEAIVTRILDGEGKRIDFAGLSLAYHGLPLMTGKGAATDDFPDRSREILCGGGAAMWVRRDAFLEAGGFDPDYFAYFEDVDLGWRMKLMGYRTWYLPEAVSRHRAHGTMSRERGAFVKHAYHMERNMLWTLAKNLSDTNLWPILTASVLLLNRRGMGEWRLPVPDVRFPGETADAGTPAAALSPRALARKLLGPFRGRAGPDAMRARARWHAIDGVLENVPALWEKRLRIQARRRVADAEVFGLFGDPRCHAWGEPGHIAGEETLFRAFGLERIFSGVPVEAASR